MTNKKTPLDEILKQLDEDDSWRKFQVNYPSANCGNFSIENFKIDRLDLHRLRIIRDQGPKRDPGFGNFCRLVETCSGPEGANPIRTVWMSDSRAEILEHTPVFNRLSETSRTSKKRILVNGLGLGLVVHGALSDKTVAHIDIVENNEEIIKLIGQFFEGDSRVIIHHADAYKIRWPLGTCWDIVWHDIWPEISDENLPGMKKLMRKYKRKSLWQECWQRQGCLGLKAFFKRLEKDKIPEEELNKIIQGKFEI